MPPRTLHFSVFIGPGGSHESAWRRAGGDVRGVLGLGYYAGPTLRDHLGLARPVRRQAP